MVLITFQQDKILAAPRFAPRRSVNASLLTLTLNVALTLLLTVTVILNLTVHVEVCTKCGAKIEESHNL